MYIYSTFYRRSCTFLSIVLRFYTGLNIKISRNIRDVLAVYVVTIKSVWIPTFETYGSDMSYGYDYNCYIIKS